MIQGDSWETWMVEYPNCDTIVVVRLEARVRHNQSINQSEIYIDPPIIQLVIKNDVQKDQREQFKPSRDPSWGPTHTCIRKLTSDGDYNVDIVSYI